MLRTHLATQLLNESIGEKVRLSGWVESVRDHGGIKFLDLRDYSGKMQVVLHDDSMLDGVNRETVISAIGLVFMLLLIGVILMFIGALVHWNL